MYASLRTVRRRTWLKILVLWVLFVVCFVGGLMVFLKSFINMPYVQDPEVFTHMNAPYNSSSDFPLILHHSWKTDDIPAMWRDSYNACVSLNKKYERMLWTDDKIERFMREHYSWFLPQWREYKYTIQRVDVSRYFILYHYGGVYIDLDIKCNIPFADIIRNVSRDHGVLLPNTWPLGVSNEFLVTKLHHPFLVRLVSSLRAAHHEYGLHYFTILASTGPLFVSRCLDTLPSTADIYRLPMRLHKWLYFTHVDGDTWQWWDMWLVNWWGSWLIAAGLAFILISVFVIKCCGHSNGGGLGSKGSSPKYAKFSNGNGNFHKRMMSV